MFSGRFFIIGGKNYEIRNFKIIGEKREVY